MPIFSTRRPRACPAGLTAVSVTGGISPAGASWLLIASSIICHSFVAAPGAATKLFLDAERAPAQNRLQSRQLFLLDANLFNRVVIAERLFEFEAKEGLVKLDDPVDQLFARPHADLI